MDWIYQIDINGFRAINVGWHRPSLDTFFLILSYSGLGICPTLFPFLFLLRKSTRYFVLPLIVTVALSGLVFADGFKFLIPRDRPSNLAYAIREEPHLLGSFPSGHTTTAFGLATMLMLLIWNTKYRNYGYLAIVWAVLVGISRIYRGVHWPTDVIGGACFGAGSACLVYLLLEKFGRQIPANTPS